MSDDILGDDYLGDDYLGDDYLGDDYLGDDYLGDDVLGEADILGAIRRRQFAARGRRGGRAVQRRRGGFPQQGMARRPTPGMMALARPRPPVGSPLDARLPWRQAQVAPGVMNPTEQQLFLGFAPNDGVTSFVNGGPTSKLFTARPQKPFRGERLVIDQVRTAGAVGQLVRVTNLSIGTDFQGVSTAPLPASTFAAGSFDTRLALTAAIPGIDIVIGLDFVGPALAVGESISVAVTLIGKAIL